MLSGGGGLIGGEIGGRIRRRRGIGERAITIGEGGMEGVRIGGIPADRAAEEEAEEAHGGGNGGGECVLCINPNRTGNGGGF